MRQDLRWKGAVVFFATLIFALLLFTPIGTGLFKTDPIRQGLDLKGGVELLLAPDYRLGSSAIFKLGNELVAKMQQANLAAPKVDPLGTLDSDHYEGLVLTFASPAEAQRAINLNLLPDTYKFDAMGDTKNLNFHSKVNGNQVEITILQSATDFPADSLERSMAIIENRINSEASGMAEADVRLDGKGRLDVQLPGINTLEQAKDIITATGKLTFRIDDKNSVGWHGYARYQCDLPAR